MSAEVVVKSGRPTAAAILGGVGGAYGLAFTVLGAVYNVHRSYMNYKKKKQAKKEVAPS